MVIDVVLGVRVVFDRLVHTNELVVEVGVGVVLDIQSVALDMDASVRLVVFVLVVTFVPSSRPGSATQTSLLSVFVNSPELATLSSIAWFKEWRAIIVGAKTQKSTF